MILLIALIITLIVGIVIYIPNRRWSEAGGWTAFTAAAILTGYLIVALVFSATSTKFINKDYTTIIQTLEMQRQNGNEIENAAVIGKIIDINQELNEYKYWNKTMFGWIIPDEIEELELVK